MVPPEGPQLLDLDALLSALGLRDPLPLFRELSLMGLSRASLSGVGERDGRYAAGGRWDWLQLPAGGGLDGLFVPGGVWVLLQLPAGGGVDGLFVPGRAWVWLQLPAGGGVDGLFGAGGALGWLLLVGSSCDPEPCPSLGPGLCWFEVPFPGEPPWAPADVLGGVGDVVFCFGGMLFVGPPAAPAGHLCASGLLGAPSDRILK